MQSIKNLLDIPSIKKRIQNPSIFGIPTRDIRNRRRRIIIIQIEYIKNMYMALFPASVTRVYLVLTKYAHYTTQSCFPSFKKIMAESGVKNRNTAIRATRILEAHNLVMVTRSKGRESNKYFLLDPVVWRNPDVSLINNIKKGKQWYQIDKSNCIITDTLSNIKK